MWHGWAMILGTMLLGDLPGGPGVRVDDFGRCFEAAVGGELEIPASVARRARSFRYVFVGGFRNERMPGYFAQNVAELRALGVPARQIRMILPDSDRTTEENAGEIRTRFLEIADEGRERLVVIAHSRGACDVLAFALANPAFVKDHVEALFLVQGPFGGSGLADYVLGEGVPMDRRMPLRHRIFAHVLGRLARSATRKSGPDMERTMTRQESRAYWAETLKTSADAVAIVGPRTFYVRSSIHPSRQHLGRRAIAWYEWIYHGPGDGLVALVDQSLPGVGTVIATVEATHSDLIHRCPSNRAHRGLRRALIESIVMAVGRPEAGLLEARSRESSPADAGAGFDLREDTVPEAQPRLKGHVRRKSRVPKPRPVVAADR